MSSVDFDLSEVYRLAAELAVAGPKVGRKAEKAVDKTGDSMLHDMVSAAPELTGELKGDIRKLADGTYGSTVPQGFYQEFGTSVMPPQPWAWPAAATAEKTLITEVENLGDPFT